ncbi:MAG TPA: efflux transporter outer membrane subunit [Bryobacteraceae bacterium]|nr:efflux transporter outer membrane subunit [Bryobacteraceae bacterium]
MKRHGACFLMLLLAGCTLGPKYRRPAVAVPDQYRGPASAPEASLANAKWAELYQDATLKDLIAEALEHNFDLALAAERVEEARAQFRITGAERYPFLYAAAGFTATRPSSIGANTGVPEGTSLDSSYTQAGAALSWELDLWGRLRRLTEAARAQYLATEEARHGVTISLISDVASTWFTLRERDLELEIARRTGEIATRHLELVRLRHDHGAATGLDVQQAEQLVYIAEAQVASAERDIAQAENALSLLLARPPGAIPRGKATDDYGLPPELPAGLPSSLLDRRPDIREAEQKLIAANAQIGVAKAYYFPQISLTGFLGGQSRALSELFTGPARNWSVAPGALLPIFTAGQVRVAVHLSEAQQREMLIAYQRAIYNALREVSDSLVRYDRTREQRGQQDRLVHALAEASRLSMLRYQGGMDSYLQVLDADRSLFQGRLALAQVRLQELLAFVQCYRALGGGWQ